MRYVTIWMLVAMVLIALLAAAPVMAADWAPDEYGAVMVVGDNPDARPVSAASWEIWRPTEDVQMFWSLLGLEQGYTGAGIDAGKAGGNLRGGIGYVHDDLWGIYARYTIGF